VSDEGFIGPRRAELSPDRQADILRLQSELRPALEDWRAWVEQHPEVFGDLWWDNDAWHEGTGPVQICVAVTSEGYDAFVARLAAQGERHRQVRIVVCRYSEAELRAAQQLIIERFLRPRLIETVAVSTVRNVVNVQLRSASPELEAQLRQAVAVPLHISYGTSRARSSAQRSRSSG
jgi:hypothetical protein